MSMARSIAFGIGLAMAGTDVVGAEPLQTAPLVISLVAPTQCPNEDELRALVEGNRLVSGRDASPVVANIELSLEATGRWHAHLRLDTPDGPVVRALDGGDCAELAEAVALIIAIAAEAGDAPKREPSATEDAPTRAPAPALPHVTSRAPVPTSVTGRPDASTMRDPDAGTSLLLRTWSGGELGPLPAATPVFGLAALVGHGTARVEIGALLRGEREVVVAMPNQGASIALWTVELRGCRLFGPAALCGGAEIGQMHGTGIGLDRPREGEGRWLALTAGGELRWRLVRALALFVQVDAVRPIEAPRFTFDDGTALHAPAGVGGRGQVGLEVRIR